MAETKTFLHRLDTLGYYPLPRSHADSPGFSGLLVVLRQASHGHEPEVIELRLCEWSGKTPFLHLHADMERLFSHVVCPGRIIIRSRQEREVSFYTFGGILESETLAGETIFSLRSSAPVLELVPERETIADLLADKTEGLFARLEAQHRLSMQQMLNQLVRSGPEAVYLSVLHSLLIQDGETAVSHYPDFGKMLHSEREWFQQMGRWPLIPRDLDALLQSPAVQQQATN